MLEAETITEQIRALLDALPEADAGQGAQGPAGGPAPRDALEGIRITPEWEDVAAEYARLCREANDRLRRCGEFLSRGMRSESIHLAECQPNLLALAAALQIPDLPRWTRL